MLKRIFSSFESQMWTRSLKYLFCNTAFDAHLSQVLSTDTFPVREKPTVYWMTCTVSLFQAAYQ